MTNFPFNKMPGIKDMDFTPSNLNRILIRRFPFLFEGRNPDNPILDCSRDLIKLYDQIKAKQSALPSAQRMMVVDYVEKCRAYATKEEK